MFGIRKKPKKVKPNINTALQNMSVNMLLSGMPKGIEITHRIKHEPKPLPNKVYIEIQDSHGMPWRGNATSANYGRNWVSTPGNVYIRDHDGEYRRLDQIHVVLESGY